MSIFTPTIMDDRDRRMPLAPYEPLALGGGDEDRKVRLRAAVNAPAPPPTRQEIRRGILYGAAALPVLLAGALAPAYLAFTVRAPWWATILTAVPIGAVPALVTLFLARRLAGHRIAAAYVRAGFCASCGYDLASAPVEPDGCRRCPECGAAWRT